MPSFHTLPCDWAMSRAGMCSFLKQGDGTSYHVKISEGRFHIRAVLNANVERVGYVV